MSDQPMKPVLQKPPGYRDPTVPLKPVPLPPTARKAALPPSFRPRKKRTSCCRACCCCLCISFIIVLIVVLICGALFFLWFDPKLPDFHLQTFNVSSFSIAAKPEGTLLNAATLARVEVRNSNSKLTFHYGESEVELTAGRDRETNLGTTTLPGFTQGKKNTTSLRIETKVKDEVVDEGVGRRLQAQFKSRELVVNVGVKTRVGVGVGGIKVGMLGVNVLCEGVKLKQVNAAAAGMMPRCTINTLKWINIHG